MQPEHQNNLKLYAVGSAEVGQYYIPYPQNSKVRMSKSRKPVCLSDINQFKLITDPNSQKQKVTIIPNPIINVKILNIVCGGTHTLLNSTDGKVYSWGCNDDGALGRQGEETIPLEVKLQCTIDQIAAGDAHSVFVNSQNGAIFFCGSYRGLQKTFKTQKIYLPKLISQQEITLTKKNKKIDKVVSGYNHTMILIDQVAYIRGDSQYFASGRRILARRKQTYQPVKFQAIGIKHVTNIWSGGMHCFLRTQKKDLIQYYGWGNNAYGQLGIGSNQHQEFPTEIETFENLDIVKIVGGQHHSIALTSQGKVYGFGKNDDGQLGLGQDVEAENGQIDNGTNKYIWVPRLLQLQHIVDIACGSQFSYALSNQEDQNSLYSWGLSLHFVLINGSQQNDKYQPYKVLKKVIDNKIVHQISAGGQHAIFTGSESKLGKIQADEKVKKQKFIVKKGKIFLEKIH